jgi:hypothetical protein
MIILKRFSTCNKVDHVVRTLVLTQKGTERESEHTRKKEEMVLNQEFRVHC